MARTVNPYLADAGPYAGVGQGINNLANAFLNSRPDPVKAARAQAYAWRGRESRENVLDQQDARQGRFQLGDQLADYDPTADNRPMFAQGVGTGAMEVDDLGKLMLAMNANFGGSDEQVGRSMVGTGTALGENDFVSIGDREMGRAKNAANDIALDRASMSLNERLGDAFASGGMGTLREIYEAQHPDRYADAAETAAGGANWLDLTRRNTVEEAVDEAINAYAADQGLEVSAVPLELRTRVVDEAIRGLDKGTFASPRAAAGTLLQQYNARSAGQGWWDGDPRLEFDASARATPDATLQEAADAVARGAAAGPMPSLMMPDRVTVTPQQIEEAARNKKITPAQVIEQLEAVGGQRIPGA